MKPFNDIAKATILLKEGSRFSPTLIYKVNGVATDISGGSFKWNILDKEGGSILDTITTGYTSTGTDGSISPVFEIAELAALLTAYDAGTGNLPAYHELYFSSDTTAAKFKIWLEGPIEIVRGGN